MPRQPFRAVLFHLSLLTLAVLAGPGCTVARIEHETGQVLEWTRLKSHTELPQSGRWQLPRDTRIDVRESGPAPNAEWLTAAQAGVDSVFPAHSAAARHLVLMVSWPEAQVDRAFWPDPQAPLPLRVTLYREADGALVENAEITATPRWWFDQDDSPALVQSAFSDLARSYRSRY